METTEKPIEAEDNSQEPKEDSEAQDLQSLDLVEEPDTPAPDNMASADQILSPQTPLSEVLTSLKDYPSNKKADTEQNQPAENELPTTNPSIQEPSQDVSEESSSTEKENFGNSEDLPEKEEETTDSQNEPTQKTDETQQSTTTESPSDSDDEAPDYSSKTFLKELYANGNECVTLASGAFPASEQTRELLALFSNGRFFVVEQSKYDGRVLGFEYLAKKRRFQIGKPEYVSKELLKDIYDYATQLHATDQTYTEEENQEQTRMQRDFVTVISRAAMNQVSDIHIVVADHTTVMFRVNGLMQTEMEYNREWGESFVRAAFASSDISDSNYAQNEYQAAQKLGRTPLRGSGGRLILPKNILGIRLQFNPIAFGTRYVVMRLLYADESVATPEAALLELGFTKRDTDIFYQLRAMPTGIVVVSGPTGSGKSTTLQRNMIAMLKERNYETNLITVEDPPEYPIPGARQMPVTNAGIEEAKDREFTKALSAALRSDPDSLMIGEIRTLSAADLAFRGALSGHNVWTTLHANTAGAILLRLKDMGVEDFKLQDPTIMRGMLAQRLFRKLCPACRIPAKQNLNHPAVQRLRNAFGDVGLEHAYLRGPGCAECNFRGVSGRTAVAEFILPDSTFLNLTLKGEIQKAQNYWINDLGGRTLRENALSRMFQGIIDIEEVERWTGFLDQLNLT